MAQTFLNLAQGVTGTLPTSNYVQGGISMADNWKITSGATGTNSPLANNWVRVSSTGIGTIGSAMTQSSGIFTFPSTGIYQITFMAYLEGNDDSRYNTIDIYGTINNSSYVVIAESSQFIQQTQSNAAYGCIMCSTNFDVTDTSNCKVRFHYTPASDNITLLGASSYTATHVMFTRLGDT